MTTQPIDSLALKELNMPKSDISDLRKGDGMAILENAATSYRLRDGKPDSINIDIEQLAAEIRRVDGNHQLGAAALAEALVPYLQQVFANAQLAQPTIDTTPAKAESNPGPGLTQ